MRDAKYAQITDGIDFSYGMRSDTVAELRSMGNSYGVTIREEETSSSFETVEELQAHLDQFTDFTGGK